MSLRERLLALIIGVLLLLNIVITPVFAVPESSTSSIRGTFHTTMSQLDLVQLNFSDSRSYEITNASNILYRNYHIDWAMKESKLEVSKEELQAHINSITSDITKFNQTYKTNLVVPTESVSNFESNLKELEKLYNSALSGTATKPSRPEEEKPEEDKEVPNKVPDSTNISSKKESNKIGSFVYESLVKFLEIAKRTEGQSEFILESTYSGANSVKNMVNRMFAGEYKDRLVSGTTALENDIIVSEGFNLNNDLYSKCFKNGDVKSGEISVEYKVLLACSSVYLPLSSKVGGTEFMKALDYMYADLKKKDEDKFNAIKDFYTDLVNTKTPLFALKTDEEIKTSFNEGKFLTIKKLKDLYKTGSTHDIKVLMSIPTDSSSGTDGNVSGDKEEKPVGGNDLSTNVSSGNKDLVESPSLARIGDNLKAAVRRDFSLFDVVMKNILVDIEKGPLKIEDEVLFINAMGDIVLANNMVVVPGIANPNIIKPGGYYSPYNYAFVSSYPRVSLNSSGFKMEGTNYEGKLLIGSQAPKVGEKQTIINGSSVNPVGDENLASSKHSFKVFEVTGQSTIDLKVSSKTERKIRTDILNNGAPSSSMFSWRNYVINVESKIKELGLDNSLTDKIEGVNNTLENFIIGNMGFDKSILMVPEGNTALIGDTAIALFIDNPKELSNEAIGHMATVGYNYLSANGNDLTSGMNPDINISYLDNCIIKPAIRGSSEVSFINDMYMSLNVNKMVNNIIERASIWVGTIFQNLFQDFDSFISFRNPRDLSEAGKFLGYIYLAITLALVVVLLVNVVKKVTESRLGIGLVSLVAGVLTFIFMFTIQPEFTKVYENIIGSMGGRYLYERNLITNMEDYSGISKTKLKEFGCEAVVGTLNLDYLWKDLQSVINPLSFITKDPEKSQVLNLVDLFNGSTIALRGLPSEYVSGLILKTNLDIWLRENPIIAQPVGIKGKQVVQYTAYKESSSNLDYYMSLGLIRESFIGRLNTFLTQGNFAKHSNSYNMGTEDTPRLEQKNAFAINAYMSSPYLWGNEKQVQEYFAGQPQFLSATKIPVNEDWLNLTEMLDTLPDSVYNTPWGKGLEAKKIIPRYGDQSKTYETEARNRFIKSVNNIVKRTYVEHSDLLRRASDSTQINFICLTASMVINNRVSSLTEGVLVGEYNLHDLDVKDAMELAILPPVHAFNNSPSALFDYASEELTIFGVLGIVSLYILFAGSSFIGIILSTGLFFLGLFKITQKVVIGEFKQAIVYFLKMNALLAVLALIKLGSVWCIFLSILLMDGSFILQMAVLIIYHLLAGDILRKLMKEVSSNADTLDVSPKNVMPIIVQSVGGRYGRGYGGRYGRGYGRYGNGRYGNRYNSHSSKIGRLSNDLDDGRQREVDFDAITQKNMSSVISQSQRDMNRGKTDVESIADID